MNFFIIPSISLLCSFLYYLPWLIEPQKGLGPYLIAFLWFFFAWIPLCMHCFVGIRLKLEKAQGNLAMKHLVAAFGILMAYVILGIGIWKGYMVTV